MSYLFHAFLSSPEPPSAADAKAYLLEGALFNQTPEISFQLSGEGEFRSMILRYDPKRKPMILCRLLSDEAEAARNEVVDQAELWCAGAIARAIEDAPTVLEWEVERSEMDEDAWFALHLWQAWILKPSGGWLYAPGEGIFDTNLRRSCGPR
jgi:hypothetical protein